jgi:hypothetical protein
VDTQTVIELAQSKDKDTFASLLPGLFLLISEPGESQGIGFETVVSPPSSKAGSVRPPPAPSAPSGVQVMQLAKAPNNPYPDRISVGRARNCDIVLRDSSVSKLHAHFRETEGSWYVTDLDSQNGTRVSKKKITPNEPAMVVPGSTIVFGRVTARLVDSAALYDLLKLLARVEKSLDSVRQKV